MRRGARSAVRPDAGRDRPTDRPRRRLPTCRAHPGACSRGRRGGCRRAVAPARDLVRRVASDRGGGRTRLRRGRMHVRRPPARSGGARVKGVRLLRRSLGRGMSTGAVGAERAVVAVRGGPSKRKGSGPLTAPIDLHLRAWSDLSESPGRAQVPADQCSTRSRRRLRRAQPGWPLRLRRGRNRQR